MNMKKTLFNQCQPGGLFKELLADLKTEDFQYPVLIAGGAIRDMIMCRPYRDIDLYCHEEDYYGIYSYLNPTVEGSKRSAILSDSYEDSKSDEYIHQSIAAQVIFDNREYGLINLIALQKGNAITCEEVTGRFNIGFNQAAYDGYDVYVSAQFYRDVTEATLTVLRQDWGFDGTEKCIKKLQNKYPSMCAVFPDGTTWTKAEAKLRETGQASLDFG